MGEQTYKIEAVDSRLAVVLCRDGRIIVQRDGISLDEAKECLAWVIDQMDKEQEDEEKARLN